MIDDLRKRRVLAGHCPDCGKDAAPYRLCADCRRSASLRRALNKMAGAGFVNKSRQGSASLWASVPGREREWEDYKKVFRAMPSWGEGREDDRRIQPRLRGVRVDVAETIIKILLGMGRAATVEEISAAWGRLRGERKHGSLAADLVKIMDAKARRAKKVARQAGSFQSSPAAI